MRRLTDRLNSAGRRVPGAASDSGRFDGRGARLATPLLRRVKSQYAKPSPVTEPRKLLSSVLLRLKHGSNGMPLSVAQTAAPFTCTVPAGSAHIARGPVALHLDRADHRAVAVDAALAARAVEAVEGEQLADDEAARRIGIERLGQRRPTAASRHAAAIARRANIVNPLPLPDTANRR